MKKPAGEDAGHGGSASARVGGALTRADDPQAPPRLGVARRGWRSRKWRVLRGAAARRRPSRTSTGASRACARDGREDHGQRQFLAQNLAGLITPRHVLHHDLAEQNALQVRDVRTHRGLLVRSAVDIVEQLTREPSALYPIALVLGGLGGQRPKRARRLATQLATEQAPLSVELRALLDDPLSRAANYGSLAIILAILVLMVFK